ncbi:unnamed protein product [Urochloa decumbens]|uniref:Uncharacterized protein n=1 Tax=Urochloa decumbens TaxID=240449 RepID=A0ABC8ZKU6_9POAL
MDARARLSCEGVLRDALQQLRIPASALRVSRCSPDSFLLNFETMEMRNAAYSFRKLSEGPAALHLMPWGRQVSASATVSHLFYHARVCLEGIPDHAHNVESVLHLLPAQSFVERVDYDRKTEDEKGCFILWVWCNDPEALAVQGTLKIEEPFELPEDDAVSVLQYDVIIHLDRLEDFSPPDEHMAQWPARRSFVWQLGRPDVISDPPRVSALSRLGGRRDRSPPRGGGAGGAGGGLHQVPQPNQFDMARWFGHEAGSSTQIGHGGDGSGQYRRCGAQDQMEGKRKGGSCAEKLEQDVGLNLFVKERDVVPSDSYDPMMEEASQLKISSATHLQGEVGGDIDGGDTLGERQHLEADNDNEISLGKESESVVGENDNEKQADEFRLDEMRKSAAGAVAKENVAPNMLAAGLQIDLNLEEQAEELEQEPEAILVDACSVPKEGKGHMANRAAPRGISCFTVPLKRSLLCTPILKPKNGCVKQCSNSVSAAVKQREGKKGNKVLPVEEKATTILMKASDIIGEDETVTESAQEKFGGLFVDPMEAGLMGNMRNALGMPSGGGADEFSTLLVDTDVDA